MLVVTRFEECVHQEAADDRCKEEAVPKEVVEGAVCLLSGDTGIAEGREEEEDRKYNKEDRGDRLLRMWLYIIKE